MEDKIFKIEHGNYAQRFRKEFLFGFIALTAFVLYGYYEHKEISIAFPLIIILVAGTVYFLVQLYKTRHYIYHVEFAGNELILQGYTFNKKWIQRLNVQDLTIELRSEGRDVQYYYIIKTKTKKMFAINRTFDWDYFTLLEIFREFKLRKGEKIIFDEKYYLDIMEKKASGFSQWDIFWGKDLKKKD